MSAAGNDQSGMTLFEMLVVLAIVGFISAISIVRLDRALSIYSLRQAQTTVGASLKIARARALRFDSPVVFAVSGDGAAYGMSDSELTELSGGVLLSQPANGGVTFYPDGTTTGGELALANPRGRLAVSVAPVTGVVGAGQPR